jgi:hypothetical protein
VKPLDAASRTDRVPECVYTLLHRETPYPADDVAQDALFKDSSFRRREDVVSLLATPMRVGSARVGVMFVNYKRLHRFRQDEIDRLQFFADLAAVAIRNSQLYKWISEKDGRFTYCSPEFPRPSRPTAGDGADLETSPPTADSSCRKPPPRSAIALERGPPREPAHPEPVTSCSSEGELVLLKARPRDGRVERRTTPWRQPSHEACGSPIARGPLRMVFDRPKILSAVSNLPRMPSKPRGKTAWWYAARVGGDCRRDQGFRVRGSRLADAFEAFCHAKTQGETPRGMGIGRYLS